jgi:hypothetical protein
MTYCGKKMVAHSGSKNVKFQALVITMIVLTLVLCASCGFLIETVSDPGPATTPSLRPTPASAVTVTLDEREEHFLAHLRVRGIVGDTLVTRGYTACDRLIDGYGYQDVTGWLATEMGSHPVAVIIVDAAQQVLCVGVDF